MTDTTPGPMDGRPPAPAKRRCPVTGCTDQPRYPGKDWSTFCAFHDDADNPETKAWQQQSARAQKRGASSLATWLEWALDCLDADDEVIGKPQPGVAVEYRLNDERMSRSTTYAENKAEARTALDRHPQGGDDG